MARKSGVKLRESFAKVRLFLSDVDGILTDASVFMDQEREIKRFHVMDGLGLKLLRREGIKVGWISGRTSPATLRRAHELQIDFLFQDGGRKVDAAEKILKETGFGWDQVCYMGDDILDLGMLRRAGVAVAVPQAVPEVKAAAHFITRRPGGHGAVREVVERILKAQNRWARLVEEYAA
ncbi:MAG TPA: HAD-IIIA family hydrolase [Candidatus Paceibacterota bacterium]|nr:HAD-IIIA family hydrolase [Verrucomicrobiota bacterium]HRY46983.1 HAD-IIIA family hydrolase [Candidatus Paceibacterota bacterium]